MLLMAGEAPGVSGKRLCGILSLFEPEEGPLPREALFVLDVHFRSHNARLEMPVAVDRPLGLRVADLQHKRGTVRPAPAFEKTPVRAAIDEYVVETRVGRRHRAIRHAQS